MPLCEVPAGAVPLMTIVCYGTDDGVICAPMVRSDLRFDQDEAARIGRELADLLAGACFVS